MAVPLQIDVTIRHLLDSLSQKHNFNIDDENFILTPNRVQSAYNELLSGYSQNPADILQVDFPAGNYDEMIVVKDIAFYSLCSHHMLPFYGRAAIGYLPSIDGGKARVVGLSKLARLVDVFARRFQVQERMTADIGLAIEKHLKPRGVGVCVYDAIHLCMAMRGIKKESAMMTTSYVSGEFRDDPSVRKEFFDLIRT